MTEFQAALGPTTTRFDDGSHTVRSVREDLRAESLLVLGYSISALAPNEKGAACKSFTEAVAQLRIENRTAALTRLARAASGGPPGLDAHVRGAANAADAAVRAGESVQVVMQWHGIRSQNRGECWEDNGRLVFDPRTHLEFEAVQGRAGEAMREAMREDEPVKAVEDVMQTYGMTTQMGREALEEIVVRSRAGDKVREKAHVEDVMQMYGLAMHPSRIALESIVIEGPAGAAMRAPVREGESVRSVEDVMQTYGITTRWGRMALEREAVKGPAGEAMRKGTRYVQVIMQMYGITEPYSRELLEEEAVKGPAGDSVRKGESVQMVAEKYGITTPFARFDLEREAVKGRAGDEVRAGMSVRDAVKKYGIRTRVGWDLLEREAWLRSNGRHSTTQ